MNVLVTGAAGFIGSHVCHALLNRGDQVVGVDNVNDYYDVRLKRARIERLRDRRGFAFFECDIADADGLDAVSERAGPFRRVVHLAAQAGVRYSLENPLSYVEANLRGHVVVLELCRRTEAFEHLVYASSSSVYGGNKKVPFSVSDRIDRPISLYAATKAADELMSHTYSHLFGMPQTGLRFFTVYGPWGRPDMALYLFTDAIYAGRPIRVFNYGDMRRDFTYVDDIVDGVIRALDRPPAVAGDSAPHQVYNLGNNRSEPLTRLIEILEDTIGRRAERKLEPIPPGDVPETFADITESTRDLGYAPKVSIDQGIPRFVAWYHDYHGIA
jgi:UDP-glucuronate 4-epimerase